MITGIKELKDKNFLLEGEILAAIVKYEKETGLTPDVEIIKNGEQNKIGLRSWYTVNVTVKIET